MANVFRVLTPLVLVSVLAIVIAAGYEYWPVTRLILDIAAYAGGFAGLIALGWFAYFRAQSIKARGLARLAVAEAQIKGLQGDREGVSAFYIRMLQREACITMMIHTLPLGTDEASTQAWIDARYPNENTPNPDADSPRLQQSLTRVIPKATKQQLPKDHPQRKPTRSKPRGKK